MVGLLFKCCDMSDKYIIGGQMKYRITLFCFICCLTVCGQNNAGAYNKADKHYKRKNYRAAIDVYQKVMNEYGDDGSATVYGKLGDSYYFTGDYGNAAMWYGKQYMVDDEKFKDNDFKYGHSLKAVGEYEKADNLLARYYKERNADYVSTKELLAKIDSGQTISFEAHKFEKYNSEYSAYPALLRRDQLYIAMAVVDNGLTANFLNNVPTYDIFLFVNNGRQKKIKGIDRGYNEVAMTLSPDGRTMYFAANDKMDSNVDSPSLLKLYRASRKKNKWGNIEMLSINKKGYSFTQPTLSVDGRMLYFVSDMPSNESKGGLDIFRVPIFGGEAFGDVENMTVLNTIGDEQFPYISNNGTLYFSSNGHPGLGGLDVFMAVPKEGDENDFNKPKNLGTQINSRMDDFSFVADSNTYQGYFASNRDVLQKDEVYQFSFKEKTGAEPDIPNSDDDVDDVVMGEVKSLIRNMAFYFEFNSHVLKPEAKEEVYELSQILIKYPELQIKLAGYADNVGGVEYNFELSKKRAEEVSFYLYQFGISRNRISTEVLGKSRLLDASCTGNCEKNRAVVVTMILMNDM